jgi:osmotically-inducible protein OsmY
MKTDAELKRDVENELQWEPSIDAANIGVAVKDGVVTLTGTVPNWSQRLTAEKAAKRVRGVKAIANDIEVRLIAADERTDADIAKAARNALEWDVVVPADQITVTVSNGWVKLEGEVEWNYEKSAAEHAVRNLAGVKGVTNLLTVKPKVQPADLKAKIENALRRLVEEDAQKIRVETEGSKVILRGRVRSWVEREEAEDAAWAAPGVSSVENHIVVVP